MTEWYIKRTYRQDDTVDTLLTVVALVSAGVAGWFWRAAWREENPR